MKSIWTLSLQGNTATKRQVTALAEAYCKSRANVSYFSFYPAPAAQTDNADLALNRAIIWSEILSPAQLETMGLSPPWPELVISARPEVAAVALGIKSASGNRTKVIHIQNPNGVGQYRFDLGAFDLIVSQPQEDLSGPNVISSKLALHGLTPNIFNEFRASRREVFGLLKAPIVGVLIGGSDENIFVNQRDYEIFSGELSALADNTDGTLVVLTSRRTGEENKKILAGALQNKPNVFFDDPRCGYMLVIASAQAAYITGDSLSMVSEVLARDKPCCPCTIYELGGDQKPHPLRSKAFEALVQEGVLGYYPNKPTNPRSIPDGSPDIVRLIEGSRPDLIL